MIFLVNDANILIDLLKLDLLEMFFQLEGYDFQVTDLVLNEVQEENINTLSVYLETRLLTMQEFTFTELSEIGAISGEHPRLSVPDCSCIYLAEKLGATLLTGDGPLRKIAESRNIPVHGLLWTMIELVANGLLTKIDAYEKLLRLMEINQRLPQNECRKLLREWSE